MNRVAIDLGIIQIYWYSIFIFLGLITGCILLFKQSKNKNIDEDFLVNMIFYSILFGILGARLYYVIFNLPYYIEHPGEIIAIWNGGLAIHGGIIAGLITILYHCHKYDVKPITIIDMSVVSIIIGQAIGRWGNFFNGEAFGRITTLASLQKQYIPKFIINGMYIDGFYREPTFYYESIGCLIGFFILIIIKQFKNIKEGTLTAVYLIWYGLLRFFIEALRTDSLMLGKIKIAQLVSLIFVVIGIISLLTKYISIKIKKNGEDI